MFVRPVFLFSLFCSLALFYMLMQGPKMLHTNFNTHTTHTYTNQSRKQPKIKREKVDGTLPNENQKNFPK